LRNAAMMDTEALPAAFQKPLVVRALEELQVLSQTDLERERYESRRKAQLDDQTRLKVARLEGREEGREEGRQEGIEKGAVQDGWKRRSASSKSSSACSIGRKRRRPNWPPVRWRNWHSLPRICRSKCCGGNEGLSHPMQSWRRYRRHPRQTLASGHISTKMNALHLRGMGVSAAAKPTGSAPAP
jgi:hypothetical protein